GGGTATESGSVVRGVPGDADLATQIRAVEDIVAQERGLRAGEYTIDLVGVDEVQRQAVEITAEELEGERDRLAGLGAALVDLGALPAGSDLAQVQLDAVEAGVGGFYDPDTRRLV